MAILVWNWYSFIILLFSLIGAVLSLVGAVAFHNSME